MVGEVDEGRYVAAAPMTFGELLERWLAMKRQHVEPSTIANYEWAAGKFLRPAFADRKLAAMTNDLVP